MSVNWIDVFIILILVFMMYWGYRDGLTAGIFRFIGVIGALFCAFRFMHPLANYLSFGASLSIIFLKLGAFIILFLATYSSVQICKIVLQKYGKATSVYGRVGGVGIGLLKGVLLVFGLLLLLASFPLQSLERQIKKDTFIAGKMLRSIPHIYGYMTESWRGVWILEVKRYLNNLSRFTEERALVVRRL